MIGLRRPAPPPEGRTRDAEVKTNTWAVVLAGGQGARLRGLTRHVYGEERPNDLFASGALWNTSVFAGRAATLIDAGRQWLPSLHERLTRLTAFLGTEHERCALRQAYELAPQANFSRAVLERLPRTLAVMRLSGVAWRDLGTPRRLMQTLNELGLRPDWLAALGPPEPALRNGTSSPVEVLRDSWRP